MTFWNRTPAQASKRFFHSLSLAIVTEDELVKWTMVYIFNVNIYFIQKLSKLHFCTIFRLLFWTVIMNRLRLHQQRFLNRRNRYRKITYRLFRDSHNSYIENLEFWTANREKKSSDELRAMSIELEWLAAKHTRFSTNGTKYLLNINKIRFERLRVQTTTAHTKDISTATTTKTRNIANNSLVNSYSYVSCFGRHRKSKREKASRSFHALSNLHVDIE